MATTTNYGWTTPDDTALVKDGAAAIRTLGSSVDTTTKNLNPETTLGDIAYRSSTANVKTRLGLGTAGQVLQVNSGANAPEWATLSSGGMTLLSTTTLSGATTTISGIDQTYKYLFGVIYGMTNATTDGYASIRPNASATITTTTVIDDTSSTSTNIWYLSSNATFDRTSANNAFAFTIDNYASTTNYKPVNWNGFYTGTGPANRGLVGGGGIRTTSAITSLVFLNSGGNHSAGTVELYGVK